MSWRVTPRGRHQDYPRTMLRLTDFFTKYQPDTEERMAYIDFLIKVIKADVIGSAIANLAYDDFVNADDDNPFPFDVYLDCKGEQEIVVSKNNLLVLPSEEDKMFEVVQDVKKSGFIPETRAGQKPYPIANYFPEIDLAIAHGQRHHLTAAIADNCSVKIYAQVYNLSDAFDKYDTDGINWYSTENFYTQKRDAVVDVRLAMLYTFAQWKHKISLGEKIEDGYRKNS